MLTGVVTPQAAAEPPATAATRVSRQLGLALLIVLGLLLVEALLEGWLVTVFGGVHLDAKGRSVSDPAQWPKTVKTVLYGVLFVLTVAKFAVDRGWSRLRTKADLALLVLAIIMIAAGFVGGSTTVLIGQALYVYFRGVLVFYALRALNPSWREVKVLLWTAGTVVTAGAVLGIGQIVLGKSAFSGLGWIDMRWAGENRAQGLFDHPNNLGHAAGLMILGLVAWFLTLDRITARWWALLVVLSVALAVTQSRQSLIATVAGVAVIALLRRARFKRVVALGLVVAILGALPMVLSPENRALLSARLGGLFNSFTMSETTDYKAGCPVDEDVCPGEEGEIRVLFIKQGLRLWEAQPVLGYGVGQFGGIVAVKNNPQWNLNPKFQEVLGPQGFFLHRFKSTSVDVFWLHLLVEVGALGLLAYLVWMYLVAAPLVRAAWQRHEPVMLWSAAAVAFAVIVAVWSPALEDPFFPALLFGVLGIGWTRLRQDRGSQAGKAEIT